MHKSKLHAVNTYIYVNYAINADIFFNGETATYMIFLTYRSIVYIELI